MNGPDWRWKILTSSMAGNLLEGVADEEILS